MPRANRSPPGGTIGIAIIRQLFAGFDGAHEDVAVCRLAPAEAQQHLQRLRRQLVSRAPAVPEHLAANRDVFQHYVFWVRCRLEQTGINKTVRDTAGTDRFPSASAAAALPVNNQRGLQRKAPHRGARAASSSARPWKDDRACQAVCAPTTPPYPPSTHYRRSASPRDLPNCESKQWPSATISRGALAILGTSVKRP